MTPVRVGRAFFARYTPLVARELIGCLLVRRLGDRRLSGIIVEAEAYRGGGAPASHAYGGKTPRNSVMYGEAGHAYVYFVYGFHNCLNITTEAVGTPGAVLIRAIEPKEGSPEMLRNRGGPGVKHLTDGPGRMTQALSIDRELNWEDLAKSASLYLEFGEGNMDVVAGPRVGVNSAKERRWRFCMQGSRFVSDPKPPGFRRTIN